MTKNSLIQWTKLTWNPWHGCKKVSPGCKFCYMYRDKARYNQNPVIVQRSRQETFNSPLKWREPGFVFTCSWSDFFIDEADKWRQNAWDIIRRTPHLIYQILTKRPERIKQCLPPDWGDGWQNVWLGTSVENQKNIQSPGSNIGRHSSTRSVFVGRTVDRPDRVCRRDAIRGVKISVRQNRVGHRRRGIWKHDRRISVSSMFDSMD